MAKGIKKSSFYIVMIVSSFIMLYPLLWMISSSFKPNAYIFTTAENLWPVNFTLRNYIHGWQGSGTVSFREYFMNSAIVTVMGTIGAVISSSVVAFGFARHQFKGQKLLFAIMMSTMLLPGQVFLIPRYIIYRELNWLNTFLPLIVPSYFALNPFFVFLNMQFMRGVPRELDESAMLDGCSRWSLYRHIILPLSTPALITSLIFAFYWTWQEFLEPLVFISDPSRYTFPLAISMFADPTLQTDWGAMFAMSVLSLIPVFVIFLFFQKYLVEGISTSGLKG